MIDEEGKKVSRLSNIINHQITANFFGNLYKQDKIFAQKSTKYILIHCVKFYVY